MGQFFALPSFRRVTYAKNLAWGRGYVFVLIELTIPANSPQNLLNAQKRKCQKSFYQLLLSDLDTLGRKTTLIYHGLIIHYLTGTGYS